MVTAFVVAVAAALLLVAGLVLDGGLNLNAKRQAINEAEQAARAGAQVVDEDALRRGGAGRFRIDEDDVAAVVDAFERPGHDARVVSVDGTTIVVEVSFEQRRRFFPGVSTIVGRGTAEIQRGVSAPE